MAPTRGIGSGGKCHMCITCEHVEHMEYMCGIYKFHSSNIGVYPIHVIHVQNYMYNTGVYPTHVELHV